MKVVSVYHLIPMLSTILPVKPFLPVFMGRMVVGADIGRGAAYVTSNTTGLPTNYVLKMAFYIRARGERSDVSQ
jgi:hypothetical protein